MIIHSIKYISLALLIFVTLGLAGCSSDTVVTPEEVDPATSKEDLLTLCLNVSFDGQSSPTRADKGPDNYEDPSGNPEMINNLRVIIIHLLNEDKTSGVVEANRLVATNDQGRPLYDNLEFNVVANEYKRIYLIANETYLTAPEGFDGTPSAFLNSFEPNKKGQDDVPQIVDLSLLTDWTVAIPGVTETTTEVSTNIFSLAVNDNRRLPMTEFFDIYLDRTKAIYDTFYSHLFLTRAAAKARFYLDASDNFGDVVMDQDGNEIKINGNTRITAIELSGVGTKEYVFPNNTEYARSKTEIIGDTPDFNGVVKTYITKFTTPPDNRTVPYYINNLNVEIKKPKESELEDILPQTPTTQEGLKAKPLTSYPIYFPESILNPGQKYTVRVQINGTNWLSAELETNILSIPQKAEDSETVVNLEAIARNTYLPIVLNFNAAGIFSVKVIPWERQDYYVDYTANIGFNDTDYLKFSGSPGQTGDYYSLNENTAELVLNYGKVAKGSFTISSPLNCTWDAYLITTGGVTDAIQFVPDLDHPEQTVTHISGTVGTPANFGIVATVEPGDANNTAELIVIVTLADGTPVMANVIGNWELNQDVKRLTVIENRK